MNKNFLNRIYAYRFLGEFILILPLFAVMFADHGLSTLKISFLFLIWSGTSFIFEIPAGILADKYSRRHLLFFAQLAQAACFICWIIFPTFYGFLIGNIFWGIRDAFTSGTFEALVYDELKNSSKEDMYAKVIGRAGSTYFLATMLASITASFAIAYGYSFILIASAATALSAGIIALFLPSAPKVRNSSDKKYFLLAAQGFGILKENPTIRNAVIIASTTAMLSMGLFEFWTLVANQAGIPHRWLGIFLAVIAGLQVLSSFIAHKYENVSKQILYTIFILGGLLIIALGIRLSIPNLMLIIIFNCLFTFLIVLFNANLQHSISSEVRATVLSVSSFVTRLGIFVITLIFGLLVDRFSYNLALEFFGGLILVIGLIYLLSSLNKASIPEA